MAFVIEDAPAATGGRFVVHDEPGGFAARVRAFDEKSKTIPRDVLAGAIHGAAGIGATILSPLDAMGLTGMTSAERRGKITEALTDLTGADKESLAFKGGELGAEIAGTAGVGGAIVKGAQLVKYAPRLAAAIESGGFKLGGSAATTTGERVANAALRTAGGAITGGASAGLVNPSDAGAGAAIGGALPGAVKVAGIAGKALASEVAPEVAALYQRAKTLGIDIPADRLANSKPLNAVAASLNYVPFSGRSATEERMVSQFNRAISRTFGQDTPNLAQAVKKADQSLGDKFEFTLKNNTVKVDQKLMQDVDANLAKAKKELTPDEFSIIRNQAEDLVGKIGSGGMNEIDGQAAYNIKKTLDRLANSNSNYAFHAGQLRSSLFDALDRSLGPTEAEKFAQLRKQWGAKEEVSGMVKHAAEAGISPALIANKTSLRNPELNELADIAGQFLKTRESPHGALQRLVIGSTAATIGHGVGALPYVAGVVPAGRAANVALNSDTMKRALLRDPVLAAKAQQIAENKPLRALIYSGARSNP